MSQGLDSISCTHERPKKPDFECGTYRQSVELLEVRLHLAPIREIAALHVMAEDFLAKFLEPPLVRRFMNPVNGRAADRHQTAGNGLVGQQHEFLNELM